MPRQDIYRIVSELQELGIVEKILTKPVRFQSIPMELACSILLKRKKDEYAKTKAIQKRFLRSFNGNTQIVLPQRNEFQFVVVQGKEALYRSIKENFVKSRERVEIVTTQERFLQSLGYLGFLYKEKLRANVTFKVVTKRPADEEAFFAAIGELATFPNLELRHIDEDPRANVAIFDGKTGLAAVNPNAPLLKAPVVCTDNLAFVALFQDHFKKTWSLGANYDASARRGTGRSFSR